ncbi:MAG: hypothetical protein KKA32_01530 [Actinobacteria bacterium]|nr:hypothetical protein [Actinomycetota bacterium]
MFRTAATFAPRRDYRSGKSDVDFLVEFGPMGGHSTAHAYFDMLDELRELLGTEVGRVAPAVVDGISHAHMIVGFRNVLAHDDAAAAPISFRWWYHRQYSRRYHT